MITLYFHLILNHSDMLLHHEVSIVIYLFLHIPSCSDFLIIFVICQWVLVLLDVTCDQLDSIDQRCNKRSSILKAKPIIICSHCGRAVAVLGGREQERAWLLQNSPRQSASIQPGDCRTGDGGIPWNLGCLWRARRVLLSRWDEGWVCGWG